MIRSEDQRKIQAEEGLLRQDEQDGMSKAKKENRAGRRTKSHEGRGS